MRARVPGIVAGGLVAAVLTAAIGGAAFAQTPPVTPTGTPRPTIQQRAEEFFAALASKLGKTPEEVRAAVIGVQKDRIAQEVQAGRLTQRQADRLDQLIDRTGAPKERPARPTPTPRPSGTSA